MKPAPSALTLHGYWKKTRRTTLILLAVWFISTFTVIFFARELNHVHLFGWPISFYMAAQGMMLIYLAIVIFYTIRMRNLERRLQLSGEQQHGE